MNRQALDRMFPDWFTARWLFVPSKERGKKYGRHGCYPPSNIASGVIGGAWQP